jgi:hypothetical protein
MAVKVSREEEAAHDAALAFNEKWHRGGWTAVRTHKLEFLREIERLARAFLDSIDWRADVVVTPKKPTNALIEKREGATPR